MITCYPRSGERCEAILVSTSHVRGENRLVFLNEAIRGSISNEPDICTTISYISLPYSLYVCIPYLLIHDFRMPAIST